MKSILTGLLIMIASAIYAQTEIRQEFDISGVKEINMNFKFPEFVKVRSWDGDKVLITGSAMVNLGKNDKNFVINGDKQSESLYITSEIRDIDQIPIRLWARGANGTVHFFNAKDWNSPEVQQYIEENPDHRSISNGVIKQIKLEILVPRNVALNINCKFGLLEIQDFDAPLNANSKFGGIDISFISGASGDLIAKSKFGEIYTNLEVDFNGRDGFSKEPNKWLVVQSRLNGGGKSFILESEHGDLFLRKN